MTTYAFSPLGSSVAVTAPNGSGAAVVALPGAQTGNQALPNAGGDSVLVTNTVAFPVSVKISAAPGIVAAATDIIIPANGQRVLSTPLDSAYVSAWGIGGTGTVYFQRGDGGL